MKYFHMHFIFVALISVFAFHCGKQTETYTKETIDGVAHIHNIEPKWGVDQKISLEFVRKIGEFESEDENYELFRPSDIATDALGTIYVLDAGNFRIQKYDNDLNYILTIGGQGQGPGEFQKPSKLRIINNEMIVVYDLNLRTDYFDLNGTFISSSRNDKYFNDAAILSNGDIVGRSNLILGKGVEVKKLAKIGLVLNNEKKDTIFRLNSDGETIMRFGDTPEYPDALGELKGLAGNVIVAVDTEDNIIINYRNLNRIEKYSKDGTLLFILDRELGYEAGITQNYQIFQFATGLETDHKNRIWSVTIKENDFPDETELLTKNFVVNNILMLEIFDTDGVLLGRIPPPLDFSIMRIKGDRVYLFEYQEDMSIHEYRIVDH